MTKPSYQTDSLKDTPPAQAQDESGAKAEPPELLSKAEAAAAAPATDELQSNDSTPTAQQLQQRKRQAAEEAMAERVKKLTDANGQTMQAEFKKLAEKEAAKNQRAQDGLLKMLTELKATMEAQAAGTKAAIKDQVDNQLQAAKQAVIAQTAAAKTAAAAAAATTAATAPSATIPTADVDKQAKCRLPGCVEDARVEPGEDAAANMAYCDDSHHDADKLGMMKNADGSVGKFAPGAPPKAKAKPAPVANIFNVASKAATARSTAKAAGVKAPRAAAQQDRGNMIPRMVALTADHAYSNVAHYFEAMLQGGFAKEVADKRYNQKGPHVVSTKFVARLGTTNLPDPTHKAAMLPAHGDYNNGLYLEGISTIIMTALIVTFANGAGEDIDFDRMMAIIMAQLNEARVAAFNANNDATEAQAQDHQRKHLVKIVIAAMRGKHTPALHRMPAFEAAKEASAAALAAKEATQEASRKQAGQKQQNNPKKRQASPASPRGGKRAKSPHQGGHHQQRKAPVQYRGPPCARVTCTCKSRFNGNWQGNFYCCKRCRNGRACHSNRHPVPIDITECMTSSILYTGPMCSARGCPCTASFNGVAAKFCCRQCRDGRTCTTNIHSVPWHMKWQAEHAEWC